LAAAITPFREGGDALDEAAFGPMLAFLDRGGLDGILALGTTGEGILLTVDERCRAAELFLAARPREGFAVAVHCGAQTTGDTVALSAHAAAAAADAVAVIAPPYFGLDAPALLAHFRAAAAACAPVPFYVYEFAARSGYAVPLSVVGDLREAASNFRGMKVSDTPFDAVEPYVIQGLDLFVGSEPLVLQGLDRGAAGAVSGLSAAFPEIVSALVHEQSRAAHEAVCELRRAIADLPFHASMKAVLAARGVPVGPDVRPPLRSLSDGERRAALGTLRLVGHPE
jgi:4-hydroxy-tetrahydrodipicolinate synthase